MTSNKKCKIGSKKVMCGSHDPIFEFWDPLISRKWWMAKTSNLAWRLTAVTSNEKKCKIGSKKVMWGSLVPILEFRDPPNLSQMVEARNFKFGMETDGGDF